MARRFVVMLLTLLFGLPTAAGAVLHRCGGELVEHCACDHGAELRAEVAVCCSEESIAPTPAFVVGEAGAVALLEPAAIISVPMLSAPEVDTWQVAEEQVSPPARGPPKIPIFLLHRVLLN